VSLEKCRERFKSFLEQHDLRLTGQRMAIFDAAFGQSTHFTAEELLDKSRAIDESVSRATVYRTLPIMIESGLMREVDIGKSLKYYLPNNPEDSQQQAQVICVDCDKIFEVAAPFMEWYGSTVSGRLGLSPVSQRLQVTATCNEFRRSGRCKNRRATAR
jgi:Fur family ferric uptake transcriptional regulator